MYAALSTPLLAGLFLVCVAAIWMAGTRLSDATDVLSVRLGLGEALGGMLLLAIATNLPEIAIVVSAAVAGHLEIATGNILGGIAIQTVVLVVLDVAGDRGRNPLTYRVANLGLVLEGVLVVAVLIVSIMASQLPVASSPWLTRLPPGEVLIVLLWILGLHLVSRSRSNLPWHAGGDAPGGQTRKGARHVAERDAKPTMSTRRAALVFGVASLVTLLAGVVLEGSGSAIAEQLGVSGVLFGATVLATATALPEISTGIAAIRLGDDQLAVSDIFGGNAFLPCLFLVASLISGQAVLTAAHDIDIYLAGLGILLTCIYLYGLILRPQKKLLRMGIDSFSVLLLYAAGMAGLVLIVLEAN